MIVPLAECGATALVSLPIFAFWIVRYARRAPVWEYALDVPLAVAVDLLAVLIVGRFVMLETAVLLTRPVWIVAAGARVWRRGNRVGRPVRPSRWTAWSVRTALLAGASGAIAFLLSMAISRPFAVADRPLHAPLVASIAAQKLPFEHVFGGPLRYHMAGDVFAAMLRASSFDVISSNLALSLAHDLLFAFAAVTVALLLISFGAHRGWYVVLGSLAILLHGPIPLHGGPGGSPNGYSYYQFFLLSYRPHYPMSLLLIIGLLGVLAVRADRRQECSPRRVVAILVSGTAALAITDEASLLLVGPALGVTWILCPWLFGLDRRWGVLVMVALGSCALAANFLFNGSLVPGGPAQSISWLPTAQVPGLENASLPLASAQGKLAFAFDLLPPAACYLALALVARHQRAHRMFGLLCVSGAILVMCAVLALHLRLNGEMRGYEMHRLFVAPFVATVLYALLYLPRMPPGSLSKMSALLGLAVPAIFTLQWLHESAEATFHDYRETDANPWAKETTTHLDCRREAGAHLGERPRLTYVDAAEHYVFTSCRPIFGPGRLQSWATLKTLPQFESIPQLRDIDAALGTSGASLDAICPVDELRGDPVCRYLAGRGRADCGREGTRYLRCTLTAHDRAAILAGR